MLEPGCRFPLDDGRERLVIAVFGETKVVDGVETRVVEERESERGALAEVSRNYFFATSTRTDSVFHEGSSRNLHERAARRGGHAARARGPRIQRKVYAPGVGLLQGGSLRLVQHGV